MESENLFDTVNNSVRASNAATSSSSSDAATGEEGSFPVWVGSLADTVQEDDLKENFQQFGSIVKVRLMLDLATNVSRNFGYVNFVYEKDAFRAAQQMDGVKIHDCVIKTKDPNIVKLFKSKRESKKDSHHYCRDEQKSGGCGRGDSCKYLHIAVDGPPDTDMYGGGQDMHGGSQAMRGGGRYAMHGGSQGMRGGREDFMSNKSSEYCRDETKPRGCGRGDECRFLHVAVDGPPPQTMQGGMSMNDVQGFNPMAMQATQSMYNNPMADRYGMMEPPLKRTAMGAMGEEKYKEQRDELRNKVIDLRDMNEKLTDLNKQLRSRLDERLKILASYEPVISSAPTEKLQRKDRDSDLFDDNEPTRQDITNDSSTNHDYGYEYGS